MINTLEEANGREWQNRTKNADEVRKKLRTGWKHDAAILNQYFQSCYTNWKVYKGDRTPKQVLKLQAIYKQAVYGDNPEPPPENLETVEGQKWQAWNKLKGTPCDTAKRRFITFLSEINPTLIDVMPDEKPPTGFPLDRRGNPICAKCNTVVGCARPLLDQFKMNLRTQLFENEEFHDPDRLTLWIQNAITNQRCVWGIHQPITKAEARPFMDWFNREENRGFFPYDSLSLMKIIKELVFYYHEVVYDLMQHKQEVAAEVYNHQAKRTAKLKEIFEAFAGEEFLFELPCTRDTEVCNSRRAADGGRNHKHEVILDPPTHSDANTMEEAIQLRIQCQKLGLNPCTGVVKNTAERCNIYRKRIAEHFEALKKAAEAKERNDLRIPKHKEDKKKVMALSKNIIERQCWEACNRNLVDQVRTLVKRGCNPNEESSRGLTPLLTMILNEVATEKIEEIITYKVDVNLPNRYGMTPLMLACRLKDTKMVHVLMKNGASALHKGYNGRTALHTCVIHGNDEAAKVIAEYLKEGAGDSMRVIRFLDANDDDGESALITACRIRNGLFCHLLTQMGANPSNRNSVGRTAAYVARSKGWNEIADWLEKKVGAGVRVETYSDQQFEKQCKLGMIQLREAIQNFGKAYLLLIQHRIGIHPLGCPFKTQLMIEERGDNAIYEFQFFVDNHQKYILQHFTKEYMIQSQQNANHAMALKRKMGLLKMKEIDEETAATYYKQLKDLMNDIVAIARQGFTYANLETLPQPLPWTPLMCAVAVNDLRSAKLLMREGADPNHPNRDGMTPLMLAAQLQETEMFVELLIGGGDILSVDNQGYAPLAYASSLPLPTVMNREIKDVMTNDSVYGPKLLSVQQIIEHILNGNDFSAAAQGEANNSSNNNNNNNTNESRNKNGAASHGIIKTLSHDRRLVKINIDELNAMIQKNYEEAEGEKVENYLKQNKLLESYGLTPIDNEHNLLHQVKSSNWRVGDVSAEDAAEIQEMKRRRREAEEAADDEEEDDSVLRQLEAQMKKDFQDIEDAKKEERAKEQALYNSQLRCPICTLAIPCAHFLKIQSLMTFLTENQNKDGNNNNLSSVSSALSSYKLTRKIKIKNRLQEILDEAQIGDRRSDRSKTLADKYQGLELSLERAWQERIDQETEQQQFANEEEKEQLDRSTEELLDYHPLDPHYRPPKEQFASNTSTAITIVSNDDISIGNNTAESLATITMNDEHLSRATTAEVTERAIVPILKPPSREVSTAGPNASRKSKRVKFVLADLNEDEAPLLAITDGSEIKEPSSPVKETALIETKQQPPQHLTEAESALQILQSGESQVGSANEKSSFYESNGKRRILLVTREPIGKSHDGFTSIDKTSLVKLAPKVPPPTKKRFAIPPQAPPARPPPKSFAMIEDPIEVVKEILKTIPPPKKRIPRKSNIIPTKLKTSLSGWLFVHLAKLSTGIIPLETITISQDAWIKILDHINDKFENEWTERLDLQVLISMKSWQIQAPRCLLCGIGIIRNKQSLEQYHEDENTYHLEANNLMQQLTTYYQNIHHSPSAAGGKRKGTEGNLDYEKIHQTYEELLTVLELHLCLQCLIRKELYLKIQQSMPRSMKQSLAMKWPFLPLPEREIRKKRKNDTNDFPPLTSPMGRFPSSPTRQDSNPSLLLAAPSSPIQKSNSASPLAIMNGDESQYNPTVERNYSSIPSSPSADHYKPINLTIKTTNSALDLFAFTPHDPSKGPLGSDDDSLGNPGSIVSNSSSQLFSPGIPYKKLPYHKTVRSPHAKASPLASNKLQFLDDVEAEILSYQDPNQFARDAMDWLDNNDDNNSLPSIASVSNLSMGSANSLPTLHSSTSNSFEDTISTLSKVDPIKRPREMTLLPYLLARGHYEEAERTIRILLSKQAVDEGEGIFLLLKILSYQADMYKSMGLFPLALSLYLDITDITASLLGMSDYVTFRAVGLVMLCYQKMCKAAAAENYLKGTTRKLLTALRSELKEQMVERLHGLKRKINQDYLKLNNVWREYLYPFLERYSKGAIQRRYHEVLGIGGFYSFLTSESSVLVVTRRVFFAFCNSAECPYPEIVPLFAHFLDYCFRMRTTDEEEVYRFLVQYILQKSLAKSLVSTSPLAKLFREKTSTLKIEQIIAFIHHGQPLDICVFDEMIYYSLQLLSSCYRYFLFHSIMGQLILQEHYIDLLAEGMDIASTLIQCQYRKKKATQRVKVLLAIKREKEERERQEQLIREQARQIEEELKIEKLKAQDKPSISLPPPSASSSRNTSRTRRSILF